MELYHHPPQLDSLELLGQCVRETIDQPPMSEVGKLVLWYGSEWETYDEYDEEADSKSQWPGMSRYTAGAYMETIALRPEVITKPKYIADALNRINQNYDELEFAQGIILGMYSADETPNDQAQTVLYNTGDNGKAGHWPAVYDAEYSSSEFSEAELREIEELEPVLAKLWRNQGHYRPMEPAQVGAAIAACVPREWLTAIADRLVEKVAKSRQAAPIDMSALDLMRKY